MPTRDWAATASQVVGAGAAMRDTAVIIALHQLLFQGMFFLKNALLRRKLGQPVRGANPEAVASILFFACFIALSLWLALADRPPGHYALLAPGPALAIGLALLGANLLIGLASLKDLGDSWRVGVLEEQRTALVQSGIYRYSRNPYFLAYLLMFAGYTVLLQNALLLGLSLVGFACIHLMIGREERYLAGLHGEEYRQYCRRVPRYLLR